MSGPEVLDHPGCRVEERALGRGGFLISHPTVPFCSHRLALSDFQVPLVALENAVATLIAGTLARS